MWHLWCNMISLLMLQNNKTLVLLFCNTITTYMHVCYYVFSWSESGNYFSTKCCKHSWTTKRHYYNINKPDIKMLHRHVMSTCTLDYACLLGNISIHIATDNTLSFFKKIANCWLTLKIFCLISILWYLNLIL